MYAQPSVADDVDQRQVLLAWLGQELGEIGWDGLDQQPDLSKLAARAVAKSKQLSADEERQLAVAAPGLAAHGGRNTFRDYVTQVEAAADELFGLSDQGKLNLGKSDG